MRRPHSSILSTDPSGAKASRAAKWSLARTARRASDHFAARDAMKDAMAPDGSVDKIELWGRRIGRGLSLAGLVALAIYLTFTYFAK